MLTSRGWWFLLLVVAQIAVGILLSDRGLGGIAILGFTFLFWFLYEYCFFALQARMAVPKLRFKREIRDSRKAVPILWVGREFEVVVEVESPSLVPISFCVLNDRFPSGADQVAGRNEIAAALSAEAGATIRYSIRTISPGELRFEGTRVQIADRQGFFYLRTFVRDCVDYPVLPPLTDAEGNRRVDKSHNMIPPPGVHRLRAAGGGGDLLDLRDYRPGDPPKMIAWKASARRDRLITKEFESDVPLRCTLFVDRSQSVRLGQPRATLLNQLTMVAAGVAQAATSDRDLVGLTLFDEKELTTVRPARTSRHLISLMHMLSDAARARPVSPTGDVEELAKVALPVAEEIYPDLMDRRENRTPLRMFWNPLLDGRMAVFVLLIMLLTPILFCFGEVRQFVSRESVRILFNLGVIPRADDDFWYWVKFGVIFTLLFLIPVFIGLIWWFFHGIQTAFAPYYLKRDRRKRLASLFAALDGKSVGTIGVMLEDDGPMAERLQEFLARHHIRYPIELYDSKGRYLFRSEEKIHTLCRALQTSIARGRDNELFVILADLIELDDYLEPLMKSIRVAVGRHHQVLVVCPWLKEIPAPESDFGEEPDMRVLRREIGSKLRSPRSLSSQLLRDTMVRYHQAYYRVRRAFARMGVLLVRANEGEPVRLILNRLDRLRIRSEATMTPTKPPRRGSIRWMLANPGTRTYLIVGFAALLINFLMMASKAGEIGAILIVILAVPGLIGGWVASPAFFLILSTYMFIDPYFDGVTSYLGGYRAPFFGGQRGATTPTFRFEDILLAISGLAYLIAHYRLQGLTFRALPYEPRIRRKGDMPDADYPRPVRMVTDVEIGFVLMLAVLATILGQMGWVLLSGTERGLAVSRDILIERVVARLMLFVFALGVAMAASSAIFGYLRWNQMSKAEARLCLQDHTWQETRREQERIHRWRKWRRKREGIAEGEVRK